jgi:hypothetical protein
MNDPLTKSAADVLQEMMRAPAPLERPGLAPAWHDGTLSSAEAWRREFAHRRGEAYLLQRRMTLLDRRACFDDDELGGVVHDFDPLE